MTAPGTLVAWQEPGRTVLRHAAEWHEWSPQWLPSRVASVVRQRALRRYRSPILCQLPGGQQFFADPSDLVQCLVGTTGGWEQMIFDAVRPLVPHGSTVLDVGAHVGYAALRFGEWIGPTGRVVCFEPVPAHLVQLARNLEVNGYDARTTVVPMAVCDEAGERQFFDSGGSNTGMSSLNGGSERAPSRLVRTISIDGWLADAGMAEIALTKIDVEGAEALVLRGMARSLAEARHRAVLVELHPGVEPRIGQRVAEAFNRVAGHPYELFDWQPSGRFVPVGAAEPANYLLAVRGDSVPWQ